MPNGPAFEDAVLIAKENPGLGVGIHLSLVDERCIADTSRVRGLAAQDGSLPPTYGAFIKALALRRFGPRQVSEEIDAQVSRALESGISPTHLDSHQHLHMLPGVFASVTAIARDAGIHVIRLPLERPANRASMHRGAVCPDAEEGGAMHRAAVCTDAFRKSQIAALSLLCRFRAGQLRRHGFHVADRFWGLAASGNLTEPDLSRVVDSLQPGVNELMCHPGYSDEAMKSRYQWDYHWDQETAALCSHSIALIIDDRHIRLATFRDAW